MATARFTSAPAVEGPSFSSEFMSGMDRRLAERSNYKTLVDRHVVPSGRGTADTVLAAKHMLQTGLVKNKMNSFLGTRPAAEELVHAHILEDGYGSVAPAVQRAQKSYDLARKKDALGTSLTHRPVPSELVERNILRDVTAADSNRAKMEALRRSMLEDKLAHAIESKTRPSRHELQARGFIPMTLGDKLAALDGEDAVELLLRLAYRGGLWEAEISRELASMLEEEEVDEVALGRALASRPDKATLEGANILKMRGSGGTTRIMATRALSRKLKYRPTTADVEAANILRETDRARTDPSALESKFTRRPSVAELRSRGIIV